MQTYTDIDIASYKAALSRYAAKEKALVDKYTKCLSVLENYIFEAESLLPLPAAASALEQYNFGKKHLLQILEDLRTPADMFLTDFEMRGCK